MLILISRRLFPKERLTIIKMKNKIQNLSRKFYATLLQKSSDMNFVTRNSGFTLVETLVAISILMIAITGPLVISSQVLNYSYFARDQITAAYLAQDAIEYIRNVRDQNFLANLSNPGSKNWLAAGDTLTLVDLCGTNKKCKLDSQVSSSISVCSSDPNIGCGVMQYNKETGIYNYTSGIGGDIVDSKFTRDITLNQITDNEIQIKATVSWNTGNVKNQSLTLTENLFNWQ